LKSVGYGEPIYAPPRFVREAAPSGGFLFSRRNGRALDFRTNPSYTVRVNCPKCGNPVAPGAAFCGVCTEVLVKKAAPAAGVFVYFPRERAEE